MKYIRITLLEKMLFVLDISEPGEFRDWKIEEEYPNKYFISYGKYDRAFITKKELKAGRKDVEANFSLPTGLHVKLELIEKLTLKEKFLNLVRRI